MKNEFFHWLKGYLLWDLSLLFTFVIAISLITNYPILCHVCGCSVVPVIFMHTYRFFHLERGAVYALTLLEIFSHRQNFLHRLSAIITGLETKCLCTAGIFRNWIQIKFLANNSRQHFCVPFIFYHCSIWSPLFTKADIYFFMLMRLLLHINT